MSRVASTRPTRKPAKRRVAAPVGASAPRGVRDAPAPAAVDRGAEPIEKLARETVGANDLIAPNFRLHELTGSELASRLHIDNGFPSDDELRDAVYLARNVLQKIRDEFGPFTPNSVFRSQALERELKGKPAGWISTSQHAQGRACDVEIVGRTTLDLARWVAKNLEFDQLICECYDVAEGLSSGWVHISVVPPGRGANRGEQLSYVRDPVTKRFVYVAGLRGAPS